MTPSAIKREARKLGDGWQSKLARLMPCNERTVRYWLKGQRAIRPMVWERIKQVVAENRIILEAKLRK